MTQVADTSLLVALFDATDARHADARAALGSAAPAIVPTEILVETLGVLKVKAGRPAAVAALDGLVRLPNVTWSERCDFQGALRLYRRFPSLSFPDAIVVQECIARGADPLTYDDAQRRAVAKAKRR